MKGGRSRGWYVVAATLVVLAVAAVSMNMGRGKRAQPPAPPPIPVTVTEATKRDVPIYYDALGTVQAFNTVAIRAQVTGQLISVDFRQGQEVHKNDVLAKIDPALLKAALDQAVAKKAQDQAQLIAAQKDLQRFKTLATKNFETQQNVDQQQAKVDQSKATIDADQAAIDAAQTQLNYATILAPIDGVIGFRQVDIGNIVHPTDSSPLTVLTQITPCVAIFTLPQENLGPVREAMLQGAVSVLALDQNNQQQLAKGELLLIDNQIDQSTSTIRLKARFDNNDERLWPGEFVRIRILVMTRKDAVTVPSVAVQRGPNGLYTWVVKPDGTVDQRSIDTIPVDADVTVVTKGVAAGEQVVVDGQYRLEAGARVDAKTQTAASGPDKT